VSRVTKVPEDRLFLHASTLSFFVSQESLSVCIRVYLLHMSSFQRYRQTGLNKRFRLGIRAPLPVDFLKICTDLDIQVERHEAEGGLFVDGVFVKGGEMVDVDGRWLG